MKFANSPAGPEFPVERDQNGPKLSEKWRKQSKVNFVGKMTNITYFSPQSLKMPTNSLGICRHFLNLGGEQTVVGDQEYHASRVGKCVSKQLMKEHDCCGSACMKGK